MSHPGWAARLPARLRVPSRLRRTLPSACALLVSFGLLALYRFAAATGDFRNSDDAGNLLAGVNVAEGNWRLHGWMMAPDNYYPTDVLGQAVLKLLFGWHPIFMQGLEGLIWGGIAFLGTWLACCGIRRRALAGTISLALALLAFNTFEHGFRDVVLENVGSHGGTILLVLLTLGLAAKTTGRSGEPTWRPGRHLLALLALVTLGSLSDPIYEVTACLPILAVAILGMRSVGHRWASAAPLGVTVIGIALAHGLLWLNTRTGGFQSTSLSVTLADFPEFLDNVGFAADSMTRLLGAEFFGGSFRHHLVEGPAIYLLRAPLVVMFAVACWECGGDVYRRVREWPSSPPFPGGDLDHLLWFSTLLCIASACMTTVIINEACVRFFLPAATTGGILVARRFGRMTLPAAYGMGILLVSVVFGVLRLSHDSPRKVVAIAQVHQIVDALRSHGLKHGYAGFWQSEIVTVLSNREVTSLPIYDGKEHQLHPFAYLSNLDWFKSAARDWDGRVFFISATPDQPDPYELPQAAVFRQFGKPVERIDLGHTVINVFDLQKHALDSLASHAGYPLDPS